MSNNRMFSAASCNDVLKKLYHNLSAFDFDKKNDEDKDEGSFKFVLTEDLEDKKCLQVIFPSLTQKIFKEMVDLLKKGELTVDAIYGGEGRSENESITLPSQMCIYNSVKDILNILKKIITSVEEQSAKLLFTVTQW